MTRAITTVLVTPACRKRHGDVTKTEGWEVVG
jgi:hypothetical protein